MRGTPSEASERWEHGKRASPPALIMQASGYELRVLRGFRVQFPWDTYHGPYVAMGKRVRAAIVVHDVSVVGCFVEEESRRMLLPRFFDSGFSLQEIVEFVSICIWGLKGGKVKGQDDRNLKVSLIRD